MKRILKHLGIFVLWNLAFSAAILWLAPPLGLPVALLLAGWLLFGYVLRSGTAGAPRRWATLRLRPLRGETLRWTLIATPVLLVLSWALGEVYTGLVRIPPETFNPFGPLLERPLGRLSIALLAVAVAPILEEFFFRGLIQRTLERRWGPGWGIAGAAALFALVHALPLVFPLHFALGLAFGYAVYATRSIWSAVVLHAANNSVAMLGIGMMPDDAAARPTLWEVGPTADWWLALAVLLLSAAAAVRVARELWRAGHAPPRRAAARPNPAPSPGGAWT